jgi:hypothetical protein
LNNSNAQERRRLKRRNLSQYLPVLDSGTLQVIGHLVDVSTVGFRMDSKIPITPNHSYNLRLVFAEEIAGKVSLEFTACAKWCRSDPIQPFSYNAGFEITDIAPDDLEVFKRIPEKYAAG